MIRTQRLILAAPGDGDRAEHAAMVADAEVMADYGGPFDAARAAAHLARHRAAFDAEGFGRWAVHQAGDGAYLGYCGVARIEPTLPIAPGWEIGWRLSTAAWGRGYATEAARAALRDAFARIGADEILAYTEATNARSLSVMRKLGMRRDASRDFVHPEPVAGAEYRAVVCVADRPDWT